MVSHLKRIDRNGDKALNLDSRYTVQPGIKYRYEQSGGVIYRRVDDSLHFFNSQLVINLLELAERGTVREIAAKISQASLRGRDAEEFVLKILYLLEELNLVHELEPSNNQAAGPDLPDLADNRQM